MYKIMQFDWQDCKIYCLLMTESQLSANLTEGKNANVTFMVFIQVRKQERRQAPRQVLRQAYMQVCRQAHVGMQAAAQSGK